MSYVNNTQYNTIYEKYKYVASWAVWKDKECPNEKNNIGDVSMFHNPTDELLRQLKTNVVFVGLNISKPLEIPFENFHSTSIHAHDYKMRYALKDTPLWGAYMTDVFKGFEQIDSSKVVSYFRKNRNELEYHIQELRNEISLLSDTPILIAIGNAAYKVLNDAFNDEFVIYKIPHYSSNSSKEEIRECILDIISHI